MITGGCALLYNEIETSLIIMKMIKILNYSVQFQYLNFICKTKSKRIDPNEMKLKYSKMNNESSTPRDVHLMLTGKSCCRCEVGQRIKEATIT